MFKGFQDKGFSGIKACFFRAKRTFWVKEIKKELILQEIKKTHKAADKLSKWQTLGEKVSSKWNKISAVEEKIMAGKITVDSSVIISSLLKNESRHKEALAIWEDAVRGKSFAIMPLSILAKRLYHSIL